MSDRDMAGSGGGTPQPEGKSLGHSAKEPPLRTATHKARSRTTSLKHSGSTVVPQYGVRRPMMYHLLESEMKSVSGFNAIALTCFSVATFFVNALLGILIGWGFSAPPLSEFGEFMLHRASYYIGVLALVFFVTGIYSIFSKQSAINQIKSETSSKEEIRRSAR